MYVVVMNDSIFFFFMYVALFLTKSQSALQRKLKPKTTDKEYCKHDLHIKHY